MLAERGKICYNKKHRGPTVSSMNHGRERPFFSLEQRKGPAGKTEGAIGEMKKNVCGALLALALALGALPGGALAAEALSGTWKGYGYRDEETGEYVEGGSGTWTLDAAGTLTVEGSGGISCDSSNCPWDGHRDSVRRLVIGPGITGIGNGGWWIFESYIRLETVELPDSVKWIDDRVFRNCTALTSVTLSAGLRNIGASAFEGTCLTSLTLPAGLTKIGASAFARCDQLESIAVAAGNAAFKAVDGVVFSADGKTLVLYPSGRRGAYTVPAGTETIGDSAFSGARGLTELTLPAGLREIGRSAFDGCDGLREIAFPEGAAGPETIGDDAFSGCTALKDLTLPEGLKTLGSGAFVDCRSLTSVTFPSSLKSIGDSAFSGCYGLTEAALPEGLETVGESAFRFCSHLKKAVLPGSLASLGANTFQDCHNLTDLTLGEGISRIENRAFDRCSRIQRLMFPRSLTYIGSDVFTSAVEADIHFAGTEAEWEAVRMGYNALPEGLRVLCGSTGPVEPDLDGVQTSGWPGYNGEDTVWNLSLTIDNGGKAGTIAVRAALYDENGRFLGLREQALAVEEGERTYGLGRLVFPGVDRGSVGNAKVFLSDAAAMPLCPAH